MESLNRPMDDCGNDTPFGHLWKSGAIHGGWLLAHMNELIEEDFQLLAERAARRGAERRALPGQPSLLRPCAFSLPAAARSRREYLPRHGQPREHGFAQSVRRIAAAARRGTRGSPAEQLLRTVTVNPARALGRRGTLGKIEPGALADLIALPVSGNLAHHP